MTYPTFMAGGDTCEFCEIVAGRVSKTVIQEDDDLIVFKNAITWVPVMYLIAPKVHMSQPEFWRSPLFAKASALGVELGESLAPEGFRLVSNFGEQAMQSQPHGHLHVLGGGMLGLYMDFPRKGDFWLRNFGYTEFDPNRPSPNRPAPPPDRRPST